jgi:hypothetical protein
MVGEDRGFGVLSVRNIKGLRVNLPLEDLGSVEEGVGVAMMQTVKMVIDVRCYGKRGASRYYSVVVFALYCFLYYTESMFIYLQVCCAILVRDYFFSCIG